MPLRVSVRGQRDHALHPITDEVLKAVGFTLDDIVSWGGQVRYDDGLPIKSNRFGAMQRGEVDMIVDEAVRGWANQALDAGMRILPPMKRLNQMEAIGLRAGSCRLRASQVGQGSADVVSAASPSTPMRLPDEVIRRSAPPWTRARRDRLHSQGRCPWKELPRHR